VLEGRRGNNGKRGGGAGGGRNVVPYSGVWILESVPHDIMVALLLLSFAHCKFV